MRVVEAEADFEDALDAAQAEAGSAFGDDHVLVERYFPESRHIEVQILGDRQGKVLHLFERECSIQRRHQKIVEESPAPNLSGAQRAAITQAAVDLAREVGYFSAGTVEFLLDLDGDFYLLEMNTRLQVEHPVTECVTGIDLVDWQIRIAQGEPLSIDQAEISQRGHAIECRLYAEDPATGFLPSIGTLVHYRRPYGPGVRCDDGLASGDAITTHYDAMIAKIITQGWSRDDAIDRMRAALADTVALGVRTNLGYLQRILETPAFAEGQTTTRFVERHMAPEDAEPRQLDDRDWLSMALFEALALGGALDSAAGGAIGPEDAPDRMVRAPGPWLHRDRFRNVR